MFSFWQLISIFFVKHLHFSWKVMGDLRNCQLNWKQSKHSPSPSVKRKERKPNDTLRGSWSPAGRWEQNKWLQGNLLPEHTGEKMIYTPSHKSLYPFQKAFCFAFQTASFLPPNSVCACAPFLCESCSEHKASIPFPLLFPDCHRSSKGWECPVTEPWFGPFDVVPFNFTDTTSNSPHPLWHNSPPCSIMTEKQFSSSCFPTPLLYLSICFLILFWVFFPLFTYLFMPISPTPDSQSFNFSLHLLHYSLVMQFIY